jgi:hypothetical protein
MTAPQSPPTSGERERVEALLDSAERVYREVIALPYRIPPALCDAIEELYRALGLGLRGSNALALPARGTAEPSEDDVFPLTVKQAADAIRQAVEGKTYYDATGEEYYRDAAFAVMRAWAAARSPAETE